MTKQTPRTSRPPASPKPAPPELPREALGQLGVEIWRLGQRVVNETNPRLRDSQERILRAFQSLGGTIEDWTGDTFHDGTLAEIIDQPEAADAGADTLMVSQVVRPAVYFAGVRLVTPQVVLITSPKANTETPKQETNQ